MSSKGNKSKLNKKETYSKNSVSDITLSENNSEIQEKEKSVSISEKIHQNSRENINNILQLAKSLKNKECFNKFIKENEKIYEIYENEDKMNNALRDNSSWKLNNDMFEEQAIKILSDIYELSEYNMYPYFDVGFSKTKKSYVTKLYFNQVNISTEDDKGEKDILSFIFLADMQTYMLKYKNWPIMLQKYREDIYTLTVFTEDFQNSVDFDFKKGDKISSVSFILAEINQELMEAQNNIKKLQNEKDSLDNKDQKEEYKKKLESYKKILLSTEQKYSKGIIENEINKKKIELSISEEKIKLNKITNEEAEKTLKELKDTIAEHKALLTKVNITIEKKDREFDGFVFSSKKIVLENTIGDRLQIPEKSPIIVEVKNIIKYKTIIENIRSKKQLMTTLGFDTAKFYFIGILRGIDVNQEKKDRIKRTIFKDLNMKNMIIIYSDNFKFLGQSLRGVSTGINAGKKLDESGEKSIYEIIMQLKDDMKKEFAGVKNEINGIKNEINGIKNEINGIKNDISGFKTEMKTEISQIKAEISNINKDFAELKEKVNNKSN